MVHPLCYWCDMWTYWQTDRQQTDRQTDTKNNKNVSTDDNHVFIHASVSSRNFLKIDQHFLLKYDIKLNGSVHTLISFFLILYLQNFKVYSFRPQWHSRLLGNALLGCWPFSFSYCWSHCIWCLHRAGGKCHFPFLLWPRL